jgi:hypothetical protein
VNPGKVLGIKCYLDMFAAAAFNSDCAIADCTDPARSGTRCLSRATVQKDHVSTRATMSSRRITADCAPTTAPGAEPPRPPR